MHPIMVGTLSFGGVGIFLCLGIGCYIHVQTDLNRKEDMQEQEFVKYKERQLQERSENQSIMCVSVTLAMICTWLMWVCTYMHQMNPLINPILEK